ncbi:psuK [Symbiodinium sp. CCMP2592]|nr:psuK [Symbiodinium sp. CCMP2592]
MVDDDDLIVFLDAFDVFPNGFDGHELLRRFFSFGTPVVVAAEEPWDRTAKGCRIQSFKAYGLLEAESFLVFWV